MTEENFQAPVVQPKKNTPRDLFLHLLVVVTLYWSAISFVTLIWQAINNYFPDTLSRINYYASNYSSSLIRFHVSAIIIVFPVFIIVSWYLNKIYRRETEVRDSKMRKWLIYLTLFIASLIIMGDLVFTINTFLGGEITARFILKALSVLLVAGVIFGYYLNDVRKEIPTASAKYFAWLSGVLVLAVLVLSFIVIGSPNTARLLQFDQQKISDLQNIQSQVVNYWQRKGTMPANLSNLNDTISGYKAPVDYQTNAQYEYILKDSINLSFELCANFNFSSLPRKTDVVDYPYPLNNEISQNWEHNKGTICFQRTIDKQLYPVNTNIIPVK